MSTAVSETDPMEPVAPEGRPEPRALRGVKFALAGIGGVMLLILMALTVVDVIGRYLFSAPLIGATEMTELLLAAIIFLGLPAVALDDAHVTVDLVTDRLPDWVQPIRRALTAVFSAVVLAVVSWRIWVYAAQIGGYGGTTNNLHIPLAPLGYFCAVATAVGGLVTLGVGLVLLIRGREAAR